MRKNDLKNGLFCGFTVLFALFFFFSLFAQEDNNPSLSETLIDDVSAMITNARKTPNTILLLDTSENMAAFAYSFSYTGCREYEANVDKAYYLCENSYMSCRNVESKIMCDAYTFDCPSIKNKCNQLSDTKTKVHSMCDQIYTTYAQPDKEWTESFELDSDTKKPNTELSAATKKYVGPWDPREKYTQDLCFYDWAADAAADFLSGVDVAAEYNKETLGEDRYTNLLNSSDGVVANRRDWNCLTDGHGYMQDMDSKEREPQYPHTGDGVRTMPAGGVSGIWMNWRYATSLDVLKIMIAGVHEFAIPPRSRGENLCYGTQYRPTYQYQEYDDNGTLHVKTGCFLADLNTTNPSNSSNESIVEEQLTAMKDEVEKLWTEELKMPDDSEKSPEEETAFKAEKCRNFSILNDFPIFKDPSLTLPQTKDSGNCGRCHKWNSQEKKFEIADCTKYEGQQYNSDSLSAAKDLGEPVSQTFSRECCKAYKCSSPKCRDDDIHCQNDGFECVLGYYSIYDQDQNHCCTTLNCAEKAFDEETGESYSQRCQEQEEDGTCSRYCHYCSVGSALGVDSIQEFTGTEEILETPTDGYVYDGGENGIPVTVLMDSVGSELSGLGEHDTVTISVYYACNNFAQNGGQGEQEQHPSRLFIEDTCHGTDCENWSKSGNLKDCDEEGYTIEALISIKRDECNFEEATIKVKLQYQIGEYSKGKFTTKQVLDGDEFFYNVFAFKQGGGNNPALNEYECKSSFYSRKLATLDVSSNSLFEKGCPSADAAPYYINLQQHPDAPNVEECIGYTVQRQVLARNQWGVPTYIACSWLCRDEMRYDDAWKCAAFFNMMNLEEHGGMGEWSPCYSACARSGGGTLASVHDHKFENDPDYRDNPDPNLYKTEEGALEACCACVDREQRYYTIPLINYNLHLSTVEGVSFGKASNRRYECAVSGILHSESTIGTIETSGYYAEIVNGHLDEVPGNSSENYYALTPYLENGAYFSPYSDWYNYYTFVGVNNQAFSNSKFTLFGTSYEAEPIRENACIVDVLKNGSVECNYTDLCGNPCGPDCDDQNVDLCQFPQFWMKVPNSNGGRLISAPAISFSNDKQKHDFQTAVKSLKTSGGATLGETLYDVWRWLGGMYALHDPAYTYKGVDEEGNPKGKFYESPFADGSNEVECFSNEAIVISGGQPQFDTNNQLSKYGVSCVNMDATNAEAVPCVNHTNDIPNDAAPYYATDWFQTSFMNVAKFVNTKNFWSDNEDCRKGEVSTNAVGYTPNGSCDSYGGEDRMAIIDRVHTVTIGEWVLSPVISTSTSSIDLDLLNDTYMKRAAENTVDKDGNHGEFYGLTTENDNTSGKFSNLTDLLVNMLNHSKPSDVVSGRPHWTSSLVQAYDVEEKYKGPEVYSAGTVPIQRSISRFWFGNLKQYEVDGDGLCQMVDDPESSCGEWKKQTVPIEDCFAPDDSGGDFRGDNEESVEAFKKLMVGGAAKKLWDLVTSSPCSQLPCYEHSPRKLYYDNGREGHIENIANIADDNIAISKMGGDIDKIKRVIDYIAGYDAFALGDAKKNIRFMNDDGTIKMFNVLDPLNISLTTTNRKYVTIRPLLLGAIIHSKPIAVDYNVDGAIMKRIYAGANDGMLHAFDGSGNEVYGYIPSNGFESLMNAISEGGDDIDFKATVDGPITLLHIDQSHDGIIDEGELAYLIFGYRRGANGYTVIDISNPDEPKYIQDLNTDGGRSFGRAVVFRKCGQCTSDGVCSCAYANDLTYYLAVPGGYDTAYDPTNTYDTDKEHSNVMSPIGKKFTIYKFLRPNNSTHKFDDENPIVFNHDAESRMSVRDRSWVHAPFAATPLAINTSGKAAVNTEFVYFNDLSGTIFRVDVRNTDSNEWTARVVYTQRTDEGDASEHDDIGWTANGRSFVASNFFPPLERYNPQRKGLADTHIPIPMITGNAAQPKMIDDDKIVVIYDILNWGTSDANGVDYSKYSCTSDLEKNPNGNRELKPEELQDGRLFKSRGWKVDFGAEDVTKGEKGITEPLITFNTFLSYNNKANNEGEREVEKSQAYTIAWNTYIPKKESNCKSFGTSSSYERYLVNGSQAFEQVSMTGANGEWSTAENNGDCHINDALSIATSVGIIATEEGYAHTFGAGADIFKKSAFDVRSNETYIIRWYELY